jgi:O-acetylserine/cysteine efflux transporter
MNKDGNREGIGASTIATALLISAVWGFNFVVIKVGVGGIPPLELAALRFLFSALPAVFLVRKPDLPWKALAAYGLFLGVGEFGFLFTAIKLGAPAGLSSIILQSQAFLTALLAGIILKERLKVHNIVGMVVAGLGLLVIAFADSGSGAGPISAGSLVVPFAMLLIAALGWAAANVTARAMPTTNALGLVVWSSLFSPIPLALLSLIFEGSDRMLAAITGITPLSVGALAYLVILSTLLGYGVWNRLIVKHGAGKIAPFSLLVPIFGVASASLCLGERFSALDALATILILAGLVIHAFGSRLLRGRIGKKSTQ